MEQPKSSPRVFHRGKGVLVLLWEKAPGVDPTSAIITIRSLTEKEDERVVPLAAITYDGEFKKRVGKKLDPNTIVCEINEELSNMSRRQDYYVRIKQTDDVIQSVRVYQAGVKRPFEGEDESKNVHLHAWNPSRNKWMKLEGTQTKDGKFALLIHVQTDTCNGCGGE